MTPPGQRNDVATQEVLVGPRNLPGLLTLPAEKRGIVLFAHGSGSSRLSPRNQYVAGVLNEAGIATLLFDLLQEDEAEDRRKVFDIPLLAERLLEATDWVRQQSELAPLPAGYFGASTGAAAALVAAARRSETGDIRAVVSRGGRPDLAYEALPLVNAPTLLIVGGYDEPVIELNRAALQRLTCRKELVIIPGATHLFPEPGALEEVARLARDWFLQFLPVSVITSATEAETSSSLDSPLDPPAGGNSDPPLFRNREDAARQLAAKLKQLPLHRPLVLGIPRGGIVTGAVLARELGAELDVTLARKLRAPFQPELAVGAVGEDGFVYIDPRTAAIAGVSEEDIEEERQIQMQEIARRRELYRAVRPPASAEGRSVIVTDDGIATGSTMIAALQVVRHHNPRELIAAVPVAPPGRLEIVRSYCDRLICLAAPEDFWAVGQFYEHFEPVEDEQVVQLLQELAPARPSSGK